MKTPSPRPTMARAYAKIWKPAWTQTRPLKENMRMRSAPDGKSRANVRPIMIPWAMIALFCFAKSDAVGEPEPEDPSELLDPLCSWPAADAPDVGLLPPAAVAVAPVSTKGFKEFPPRALVRSKLKALCCECCWRLADTESLEIEDPSFTAQIQSVLLEEKSILPPLQEAQFEPATAIRGQLPLNISGRWDSQRHTSYVGSHLIVSDTRATQQGNLDRTIRSWLEIAMTQSMGKRDIRPAGGGVDHKDVCALHWASLTQAYPLQRRWSLDLEIQIAIATWRAGVRHVNFEADVIDRTVGHDLSVGRRGCSG